MAFGSARPSLHLSNCLDQWHRCLPQCGWPDSRVLGACPYRPVLERHHCLEAGSSCSANWPLCVSASSDLHRNYPRVSRTIAGNRTVSRDAGPWLDHCRTCPKGTLGGRSALANTGPCLSGLPSAHWIPAAENSLRMGRDGACPVSTAVRGLSDYLLISSLASSRFTSRSKADLY